MNSEVALKVDNPDKVLSETFNILAKTSGRPLSELSQKLRLVEDLELDSIKALTLLSEIENNFEVCLEEDPENPPKTVEELMELIYTSLENKE
jgi:acyl carrier protein